MQNTLYIEMLAFVSEADFGRRVGNGGQGDVRQRGMAGVIGLILALVDKNISLGLVSGRRRWGPTKPAASNRATSSTAESHDRCGRGQEVGRLNWRRLRCSHCGKTLVL